MGLLEDVPADGAETGRRKLRNLRARLGGGLLRGLRQRAGVSVGILLVATVAAAAAAAGPAYDAAARQSILRDAMNGLPITRSVEATEGGFVADLSGRLSAAVTHALDIQVGADTLSRDFGRPLQDVLSQVNIGSRTTPLTWHTDQCTHLKLTAGTCPQAAGQVMVSSSYARVSGLRPGDTVSTSSPYGRLTVTGVYSVPSAAELNSAYWLDGPCDDFAAEDSCTAKSPGGGGGPDAMFTPVATFTSRSSGNGPPAQGQATVWLVLAGDSVRPADLGPLASAAGRVAADTGLGAQNISVTSSIPQLAAQVTADWNALDVPVFLIAGQLLLLAWLLLFLIATDAAEARGPEVALAKLRGHGRLRTVAFGLSEPVLLLVTGCVAGTFVGWGAAAGLGGLLLRPGTATGLPALAVAAAAAAMLGGLVAVVAAARRALTRPVTEQWRRTARDATSRSWVLDAVLLTLAVAGLIELFTGGYVASARTGSLGLLVPGLLGLATAVVASRLLPAACLLLAAVSRRRGGTAAFLAVRHIARRPGGTRTTIVLTAAFSLATFAIASYTVQHGNIGHVAAAQTGAADVLTVTAPRGQDLGQIVDRVDPGGGTAVAVDRMAEGTGDGSELLAVQPQRFARVTQWTDGTGPLSSPGAITAALQPPAAPPVILPAAANAVRVSVSRAAGIPAEGHLTLWVAEEGGPDSGETPVDLGPARDGTLTAQVASQCPCEVTMVSVDTTTSFNGTDTGGLTVTGLQAQAGGTWQPVTGALDSAAGWQAGAEEPAGCSDQGARETVTTGTLVRVPGGLRWTFRTGAGCSPALHRQDVPAPLPALVASALRAQPHAPRPAAGLDGQALTITPAALIPAVPGAPATGIVVDRTYAQRAAQFDSSILVSEQVWVAPGADGVIRARLKDAGVTITGDQSTAEAISRQLRQGPALASVLFLASAAAAALLAAAAAVLGLYQAGRRRRYEYAALLAGRVPRRSLRSSVFIEQAVVLGFGVIAGVAAGLAAAALVLRNLPEFTVAPAAPPLTYAPPAAQLAVPVAAVIAALAVVAALAAAALVRSARAELLRETQP